MFIFNGLFVAILLFILLICIGNSTAIHHKINSPLHKTSKITSDDASKSDSRLTEDLDKTFNTFKRKNDIGQTIKKPKWKAIRHAADNGERRTVKQLAQRNLQKFNKSSNIPERNAKRQYIYGLPSVIPSAGLIPRQLVTFPSPGLHRGACLHHVCYHGGVCVRTRHGFYCDCPEQFIGQHCEFKRACLENPCKAAGTCTELGQGDFTCTCAIGSKGKTCELKDSCVPSPCNNEGICTEMDDGYHCTCKLGYKGDRCQKKALCYPNPCKNGATCIDRDDSQYECSCRLGFKGDLCEVFSECKNAPCVNGGTCVEMAVGYRCACLKGFVGKNCEVTLCNPNPCANDGICSVLGGQYTCACLKHYIGKHCEVLNPCRANPCLNGGECVASHSSSGYTNDGFSCKCSHGYYGNMCQMK